MPGAGTSVFGISGAGPLLERRGSFGPMEEAEDVFRIWGLPAMLVKMRQKPHAEEFVPIALGHIRRPMRRRALPNISDCMVSEVQASLHQIRERSCVCFSLRRTHSGNLRRKRVQREGTEQVAAHSRFYLVNASRGCLYPLEGGVGAQPGQFWQHIDVSHQFGAFA